MSTETQDTINVELPIAAHDEGYVGVDHAALATRERWREIAADPVGADASPLTTHVAPAVVAWIERDEFKPLDVPEAGRTIKATLRDGRVETFEVGEVSDGGPEWARVYPRGSNVARYIERALDTDLRDPYDITAWEYVDEPAVDLSTIAGNAQNIRNAADSLQAFVHDLRACADGLESDK